MSRKVKIDLGINGAFLTRRWEEPDNWMRLTKETGYDYHEFCGDVLIRFSAVIRSISWKPPGRLRKLQKSMA